MARGPPSRTPRCGVLTALPLMAQLAYGAMDMAAKERRLSCDVFFVAPDRRIQRVARGAEGKGVTFETRGFIAEVLFRPAGSRDTGSLRPA